MSKHVTRRQFLGGAALSLGYLMAKPELDSINQQAWATPTPGTYKPIGSQMKINATTLQYHTVQQKKGNRWSPVIAGKPLPLITRNDIAKSAGKRPRVALASIGQLSDIHVIDVQSPARGEFVHTRIGYAYRPNEALSNFTVLAAVKRLNKYNFGPIFGRKLDCVVVTGDMTDNNETIELEWLLKLLSGGTFYSNTGAPDKFEGVGAFGNPYFWQPESPKPDLYKRHGFPYVKNYYQSILKTPIRSEGLKMPWFAVIGNHDTCLLGSFPNRFNLEPVYTGDKKIIHFDIDDILGTPYEDAEDIQERILEDLLRGKKELFQQVTPDPKRAPYSRATFSAMHHEKRFIGAGPRGHGLPKDGRLYYTFPISDKVMGITLDTTIPKGGAHGHLGGKQMAWLKKQLAAHSSYYYNDEGKKVKGGGKDKLLMVFSHHSAEYMRGLGKPKPTDDADSLASHSPEELIEVLQRFPNVIAWVNGHSHAARINAYKHNNPVRSFWEINCPSFIDWPHLGRILEVVDNNDGTLSIFTTLFEPDVPLDPKKAKNNVDRLASLSRLVAANNFENPTETHLGKTTDCNTELLLKNPLVRAKA